MFVLSLQTEGALCSTQPPKEAGWSPNCVQRMCANAQKVGHHLKKDVVTLQLLNFSFFHNTLVNKMHIPAEQTSISKTMAALLDCNNFSVCDLAICY